MEDHHRQRRRRSGDKLVINGHGDGDDTIIDFRDVFGGPPRGLMPFGHSSGDFGVTTSSGASSSKSTNAFYKDIFCHTSTHRHSRCHRGDSTRMRSSSNISHNLPGFNIPSSSSSSPSSSSSYALKKTGLFTEEGFYDDIFGSQHGSSSSRGGKPRFCRSCKTKLASSSKSKTSSALSASTLSSEDIQIQSDNRVQEDDVMLSSFASKLRPITIPTRTKDYESSSPSSSLSGSYGESGGGRGWTPKFSLEISSFMDFPSSSEIKRSSSSIRADSFQRHNYMKPSCGSRGFSPALSPSSDTSSVFLMEKVVIMQEEEEEEEEYTAGGGSSFIIEMDRNSHYVKRMEETEGADALDEAIAWAKEKFSNQQPAFDTTRSVGMKDDETISIDSKQNNLPPAG